MHKQPQGVLSMAIASVFFFLMSILVKSCAGLPISQIVFFRGLVAMLICITQLRILKVSPWGTHRKLLLARGFLGTCALIIFFSTLHKIPLATAVTIQYLSPIFTTILTFVLLKERFYKVQTLFFLLAFVGVLQIKGFQGGDPFPLILGILGAFFAACAYTTIRKIQQQGGEHPLVIIFYFPLVTIPLITPKMITDWVDPTPLQWLSLIGIGVVVQIAQYFMTKAYQEGEGSVVSIAGYLGIIWASIGGYFLFNESIDESTVIGILFILAGVVGNTLYRSVKANKFRETID
jgi:drug/metabolite transporter (DMT)-like permease